MGKGWVLVNGHMLLMLMILKKLMFSVLVWSVLMANGLAYIMVRRCDLSNLTQYLTFCKCRMVNSP
jgi:hypothetical protein